MQSFKLEQLNFKFETSEVVLKYLEHVGLTKLKTQPHQNLTPYALDYPLPGIFEQSQGELSKPVMIRSYNS